MIYVPQHIKSLAPYKPGKSSDPAEYKHYRAILSSNENNYGPSPKAVEAITDALGNLHLYPDPQGEKLIQKLSLIHKRPKDNFILSNGLDGLLYTLFKAFAEAGDEVITNENSFIAFSKFAIMNNLKLIQIANKDYVFDLDRMLDAITSHTRIIYLCNPNNPTGAHINRDSLDSFITAVPKQVLIVVDEAYYAYAKGIDVDFPDSSRIFRSNVLSLRTFSKLYGLAGIRIGYGVGSSEVIKSLKQVKLVFNPNVLAQVGALSALEDYDHVKTTIKNNTKWIKILEKRLDEKGIRYIKSYANFVCTIFETAKEADSFNDFMKAKGILLRKLDAFTMPEAVRISIGNNNEMEYFSDVLEGF